MVATIKQFNDLLLNLQRDFPEITFVMADAYKWSPDSKSVHHKTPETPEDVWSLLHEVSHAALNHSTFTYDIELMSKEVEAWDYAQRNLAPKYNTSIPNDAIHDALETYREWLHARSVCPSCSQTGQQIKTDTYQCLNCRCLWRVNDARRCRLQRIKLVN